MNNTLWNIKKALSKFANRQPWMIISFILITLIMLNTINAALHNAGHGPTIGTPRQWFPISIFPHSPNLNSSIPYTVIFLVLLFIGVRFIKQLTVPWALVLSVFLILFGNLIQGDLSAASIHPFTEGWGQYYHEAAKINAPFSWINVFNASQENLLVHSKTHPPFAVLIHWGFLSLGGLVGLSGAFIVISLTQIPLFYIVAKTVLLRSNINSNKTKDLAKTLTLLYSVIPSVNIYSVICLDALIAVAFLVALLGVILTDEKLTITNVTILIVGFTLANALTFGGIFLIALLGIVILYRVIRSRSYNLLLGGFACGSFAILFIVGANRFLHYDHLQAFFTASHLENPQGFRLLSDPLQYFATRVEGITEILLFLGVGVLAILLHEFPNVIKADRKTAFLSASAIVILLLMFASGAFRTGETARVCLFIYPYLIMFASRSSHRTLRDMMLWAGIQTVYMQTIGNYFW